MPLKPLDQIFTELPMRIKAWSVYEYIRELGEGGELVKASGYFEALRGIPSAESAAAKSASILIRCHLYRKEKSRALNVYQALMALPPQGDVESVQVKSTLDIIHSLLDDSMSEAYSIWLELLKKSQVPDLKWRIARSGLTLLKHAYRYSDKEMAEAIYKSFDLMRQASHCRKWVEEADKIYLKKAW